MWNAKTHTQPAGSTTKGLPVAADREPVPAQSPELDGPVPAFIGQALIVKGDVSGQGDLVIEGRLEGSVHLENHRVTVTRSGRVTADIYGKIISVDGEVNGNLFGEEVSIGELGKVVGNATARKVTLANGSNFRGKIDMNANRGMSPTRVRPNGDHPLRVGQQR